MEMTQQMELTGLPRKRVALAEDAEAKPAVARKVRVRILQREPVQDMMEMALGYSPWVTAIPPCSGYWDTRVKGTDEHQRLWFSPSTDPVTGGGMWYEERAGGGLKFVGSYGEVGYQLEWRGLSQPNPEGYVWAVPGAKRARRVLL